jgi:hypothetical protein
MKGLSGGGSEGVHFPILRKKQKWERNKKSPGFSFELRNVPGSPEEIGKMLKERFAEIDLRNEYPEKTITLSEEAEFVEEVDSAIKEFNRTYTESVQSKIDLRGMAALLMHEEAHGYYDKKYLRALMASLAEQYDLPQTKDVQLLPDEEGNVPEHVVLDGEEVTARTVRTRAHEHFEEGGVIGSWKHLYAAFVRQEHETSREGRVQENVHALFTEANDGRFTARLEEYLKTTSKLPRHRVRKMQRALIRESIGSTERDGKHSPNLYAQKIRPLGAIFERNAHDPNKKILQEAIDFVARDAEGNLDRARLIRFIDAPRRELAIRYTELYKDQEERQKETGEDWDPKDFEGMDESIRQYEEAVITELASLGREAREEYHTFPESDSAYIAKLWSSYIYGQKMVFLEAIKEDLLTEKVKIGNKDAPKFQKLFSLYQKCTAILANGNDVDPGVLVSLQEAVLERKEEMKTITEEKTEKEKEVVEFNDAITESQLERLALTLSEVRLARAAFREEDVEKQKEVFGIINKRLGFDVRREVPKLLGRSLNSVEQEDLAELVDSQGVTGKVHAWKILFEAYRDHVSRY